MIILAGAAAAGGAAFLGFRHASEVRGATAVEQALGDREAQEIVPETGTPAPDPAVDYLLGLDAEDYTTYTHPVYGFSFRYPKAFELLTATWDQRAHLCKNLRFE